MRSPRLGRHTLLIRKRDIIVPWRFNVNDLFFMNPDLYRVATRVLGRTQAVRVVIPCVFATLVVTKADKLPFWDHMHMKIRAGHFVGITLRNSYTNCECKHRIMPHPTRYRARCEELCRLLLQPAHLNLQRLSSERIKKDQRNEHHDEHPRGFPHPSPHTTASPESVASHEP